MDSKSKSSKRLVGCFSTSDACWAPGPARGLVPIERACVCVILVLDPSVQLDLRYSSTFRPLSTGLCQF